MPHLVDKVTVFWEHNTQFGSFRALITLGAWSVHSECIPSYPDSEEKAKIIMDTLKQHWPKKFDKGIAIHAETWQVWD